MLAIVEIMFYGINEAIGAGIFGAVDIGGSMFVHTFGAYYGLAATYFYNPKKAKAEAHAGAGSYYGQLIAFMGTVFLWMFWPSFNGALAGEFQQQRTMVNTVLGIAGSCVAACAFSMLIKSRMEIEAVLNATLAGGVAIGTSADLLCNPGHAVLVGFAGGIVSCFGFLYLKHFCEDKLNCHDTCGVQWLHGVPGVFAGLIGCISIVRAEDNMPKEVQDATFGEIAAGNRDF